MEFKKATLLSGDCLTSIEVTGYKEMVTFSVTELEIDQEKSTKEQTHYKEISATEVYLGPDEVSSLIDALKFAREVI